MPSTLSTPPTPSTGLILTGGGARAAYQVGVLQGVAEIRREAGAAGNPFDVICGTSAGGINAATLACEADRFDAAVSGLVEAWSTLTVDRVYRADAFGVVRTGARWMTMMSLGWALRRWTRSRPRSLLDNGPLRTLLEAQVRFERLPQLLAQGHLRALAITGSSYSSGHHLTFFQAAHGVQPWVRSQRLAIEAQLGVEHLLASSAIPFIFPAHAVSVEGRAEWIGDGAMRQSAPISPAIHLGAERVLVIGAGRMHEKGPLHAVAPGTEPPSLAQIAGHALSNIFLDALAVDIERLQRINRTVALLPPQARRDSSLRHLDVLVISPSRRLDDLAAEHQHELPAALRAMLGAVGVQGRGQRARGSALVSYLLFMPGYIQALMAMGRADTLAQRAEVQRFFGWPAADLSSL